MVFASNGRATGWAGVAVRGGCVSAVLLFSRFQAPLMKDQASAGRPTCGVVRTITPLFPASAAARAGKVAACANGTISSWRFGQGPW